jgi:hypothetical protein
MKYLMESTLLTLLLTMSLPAQSTNQTKASDENLPPAPAMKVKVQDDSPLKVVGWTKWVAEGKGIEVAVQVENVSSKAVRAYSTRFTIPADRSNNGCFMFNVVKPGKVLQPTMSEVKSTWRGYPRDSTEPIPVFVDFVEFTDNSTWGIDSCQSVQWLAGMRTGGKLFAGTLLKILNNIGPAAVVKRAEAEASELQVPPHESQAWRTGFSSGVQGILQRVKDAFQDGGLPDIEPALTRPVDASGYQIEVVKPENP